jgi:hypothetical protein
MLTDDEEGGAREEAAEDGRNRLEPKVDKVMGLSS